MTVVETAVCTTTQSDMLIVNLLLISANFGWRPEAPLLIRGSFVGVFSSINQPIYTLFYTPAGLCAATLDGKGKLSNEVAIGGGEFPVGVDRYGNLDTRINVGAFKSYKDGAKYLNDQIASGFIDTIVRGSYTSALCGTLAIYNDKNLVGYGTPWTMWKCQGLSPFDGTVCAIDFKKNGAYIETLTPSLNSRDPHSRVVTIKNSYPVVGGPGLEIEFINEHTIVTYLTFMVGKFRNTYLVTVDTFSGKCRNIELESSTLMDAHPRSSHAELSSGQKSGALAVPKKNELLILRDDGVQRLSFALSKPK